jgi:hypothetical protein
LFDTNRRLIIERTATLKLPTIYQWPEIAEAGGLAAYGPSRTEVSRREARQLVKPCPALPLSSRKNLLSRINASSG